uniref:Major capsid protein n=1 Tax=Dulem virus 34 TaxID=3145752 RepID=A0AAU8B6G0_9CAUD
MKKKWIERQQEILNTARAAGRDLTAEEQAEWDKLQRQIDGEPGEGQRGAQDPAPANDPAPGEGARGAGDPAPDDASQRAVAQERQRISDIMALCREAGMDPEAYIKSGDTMDKVRAAAVTHLIKHGAPVSSRMSGDENDNFRQAAVDAMLIRAGVEVQNPAEGAEDMRNFSLRDLAIECLSRDGMGTTTSLLRMGKDDLWTMCCRQFFNPTAAFPAILDNTIKKNIVHAYQAIPTTFQLWTSKGSVSDFKPTKDHNYLAGGAGEFQRVGENGELKHDTPKTELLPQRQVDTFGRQFSMTRQAFINDDIGFISEVPGLYAASAKRTINRQVYSILVNNPAIFDGAPLFDAAHNNLITTGAKPSIETLQAIMLKMLRQTDPFGESIMVQPKYIIVPVGYGFLLSQLLETSMIDVEGIGNHTANALYQYRNKLQVIEEGALNVMAGENAAPWYMVGDKTYAKSLQVDYLNGQETPTIRRSEVPGQLGYVWDIWLDWGITAVDFRGIAKNPGVVITD